MMFWCPTSQAGAANGCRPLPRTLTSPIHARDGVTHAWLVNPTVQTLEVFRCEAGRWVLLATHEGAARVRAEPFHAVELEQASLWAW